jgi:hypothetical protein
MSAIENPSVVGQSQLCQPNFDRLDIFRIMFTISNQVAIRQLRGIRFLETTPQQRLG